jgi:ribonucleoside-triphosphate reductase (thioredoxin)
MSNYLSTYYQQFIAKSRYARWLEDQGRREDWPETVSRYIENIVADKVDVKTKYEIEQALLNLEVAPSMRGLMTAGEALFRDNTCLYNCAYTPVEKIEDFDKAMFILLCGTGVGFSVERQYVSKLPSLPESFVATDEVYVVEDSKEGWAKSLRKVMKSLYKGEIIQLDYSRVRPAGARLKTFGGRASGPAPLKDLFSFIRAIFVNAAGRKLTSIECHDIMCKIGEVVVVGGVRRSAMISLSNLSDDRMRHAKSGNWWENAGHRALANNSVAYTDKPDMETFMREWLSLVESKSGERGIFSRPASINKVKENGRRDPNWEFGTNP